MMTEYSATVDLIVILLWHYLIEKAFEGSGNLVSGLYFQSEIKSAVVP
jgi:hypothetical protein